MLKRTNQAGFTLIEVMAVVLIIGLMSTIVTMRVLANAEHARLTKAAVDVVQIHDAAVLFKLREGRWPDSIEELVAGKPPALRGYKSVPKDPWGNVYRAQPGETSAEWEVFSYGPDRVEGGEDDVSSNNIQGD